MKKKLTINDLATGNLKARKKQYITMIIGIVLAMVFSSSIVFAISGIANSISDINAEMFGKSNIIWSNTDEETVNKAKEKGIIGKYGYGHIIGRAYSTEQDNYDFVTVGWLDDNAAEFAYPVLIDGKMPAAENEIAIEALQLSKMGIDAKIGDEISFNFNAQDGTKILEQQTEKTYKLVGILKNKANNITFSTGLEYEDVPTALVCSNTDVELGGKEKLICYGMFPDGTTIRSIGKKLDDFRQANNLRSLDQWPCCISSRDAFYTNDSTAADIQSTMIFVIIIIAVFMLASCLSIINTFNSNLKERKKQIGLLRAVGTTKRQIINIYAREALILSLISTPVSCIISYFAVKLIIGLMGDDYSFHPNWWVFPATAVFGVASVMLSAIIPLVSASRITPMQAIRNIEDARRMNTKHIKSQKNYKVSSLIAKRSMTFGKGKQIAVSVILITSIIASGYALSSYTYSKDNLFSDKYDYELSLMSDGSYCAGVNFRNCNNGFSESDRRIAESSQFISNSNGYKTGKINLITTYSTSDYRKHISDRFEQDYENYSNESINKDNYQKALFSKVYETKDIEKINQLLNCSECISTEIVSADADDIKKLEKFVWDGKIDTDKLNSGEEIILLAPKAVGARYEGGEYSDIYRVTDKDTNGDDCIYFDYCDFKAGDEIEIAVINARAPTDEDGSNDNHTIIPEDTDILRKTVKIGAIMADDVSHYVPQFGIMTTANGMNHYIQGLRYKDLTFELNRECTDEIDKSIMQQMKTVEANVEQANAQSNYGYQQMQKQTNNKILIVVMAVIILIFTISLSIINNTITSSIRNSKRKIGTLRAVGADMNTVIKSYINQMLSMILWGVCIGSAGFCISFMTAYFVTKAMNRGFSFIFNPLACIVFIIVLVMICSANLYVNVKKEMKNSIVDNIREL